MVYILLAIVVFLLLVVAAINNEFDDFKKHVFEFEHSQMDINKKTCDILSVLSDYSHTHTEKE